MEDRPGAARPLRQAGRRAPPRGPGARVPPRCCSARQYAATRPASVAAGSHRWSTSAARGCASSAVAAPVHGTDHALRADLMGALLARSRDPEPHLVWLTRPGELLPHDVDLAWLAAARTAWAEAGRDLYVGRGHPPRLVGPAQRPAPRVAADPGLTDPRVTPRCGPARWCACWRGSPPAWPAARRTGRGRSGRASAARTTPRRWCRSGSAAR